MDDALKAMGQKIYATRKAAKMSRAELGRLGDLHETTVKRYEDGDIKSPNTEKLAAFAEVLNLNYQELADWWVPEGYQRMNDTELKMFRILDTLYSNNPDLTQACIVEINDDSINLWQELMGNFDHLNTAGQAKLLSYLSDLMTHPNYQRDTERSNRFFAIDRQCE